MRYISFDIGIKNFAFLVVDVDESQKEMTIKNMDNLNLLPSDKKMKNITFDNIFFRNFHQKMQHFKDIFNSCDLCLMERQLYSKQNYKACTMYHHLYAHLCIFYPNMKIIGFPSKRKYFVPETLNQSYTFRKKWGVSFIMDFLQKQKDEIGIELLQTFKKKDDIADCFLMIYSYVCK